MKKFVCPSTGGTSSVRHQAKARRPGANSPTLASTSSGIAGVPASAPASRSVALAGFQAPPTASPIRHGSTFTSAPLSSKASTVRTREPMESVSGSSGRPSAEYGKRTASALRYRAQRLPQRLRRAGFKDRRGHYISTVLLQRRNVRRDLYSQNADKTQLLRRGEVANPRQYFSQRHTLKHCHTRPLAASVLSLPLLTPVAC